MKDLSNYRQSYQKNNLSEDQLPEDPINLFHKWFCQAEEANLGIEPNAMSLGTIDLNGYPSTRIVLLKKYDERGFIFFTNYLSYKAQAIEKNPKVCASFFWSPLERQVIIRGTASKISREQTEAYFESRPRGSQLGAWASNQSKPIKNRSVLDKALKHYEEKFNSKPIPTPTHWGGFIIEPLEVEFWQGRPNRMHDRINYQISTDYKWIISRLSP